MHAQYSMHWKICCLVHRLCHFTSASTNHKNDFIKELSASYKLACLTCSLSDKELGEYFQHKKRHAGLLPLKYAVSRVGVQTDGTWVLGSNTYFSSNGNVFTCWWLPLRLVREYILGSICCCWRSPVFNIMLYLTIDPLASHRLFVLNDATSAKHILDEYPALQHQAVVRIGTVLSVLNNWLYH